jgi:hypothetical protein
MPGLTTESPALEEPEIHECPQCGYGWSSVEDAENCCPPVYHCSHCGSEWNDADDAYDCCRHSCPSCGAEHRYEDEAYQCCWYSCPECGERHEYEEDAMSCCRSSSHFNGSLPVLPETDIYDVTIPEIPGRPARLCSLEQELVAGGAMVARLLYEEGAASYDYVQTYHSSNSMSSAGMVHVEEDGSLPSEGGEVVFDRFDLSQAGPASRMSRILTKIRQIRDSGTGRDRPIRTGFEAGIHVHIAARAANGETLTPHQITALYELWCYAEDMLYSLSAAGWNRHRQPSDHYGGYCKPVPKSANETSPREVWRLMRADRYYGLNFQRVFEAVGRCSCGAATMGDWQSCDCGAFDKATVEWRVFNASTRPQTIHAWMVMAHAMTAHAAVWELGVRPEHPMGSQTAAEKRQVLNHLLRVLPLTDGERRLIRDTADRSPGL